MKAMGFLCRLSAVAAIAVSSSVAHAAILSYDLRVAPTGQPAGVTRIDAHHATTTAAGQAVQLQLFATIQNLDNSFTASTDPNTGDPAPPYTTNDGFLTGQGSFVSSPSTGPKIAGTLRGINPASSSPTAAERAVNNVSPFNSTGATSGYQSDYETDGIVDDVGKNTTHNGTTPDDWFLATSGSDPALGSFNSPPAGGPQSQLIGRITWTEGAGGGNARIDFLPRLLVDGTSTVQNLHLLTSDGVSYQLRGDSALIGNNGTQADKDALAVFIQGPPVPEPSSLVLLGLGGLGLMVWRARRRSA